MTKLLKHPLYYVWQGMLRRCYTKTNLSFHRYGGRGIIVCDEWKSSFSKFVSDMGERPPKTSLDRIDNNGNYEPGNCRWADRKTQQRNQTVTRKILIEGVEYIAADLAEIYGFKTDTIIKRSLLNLSFNELVSKDRRVFKEGLKLGGKASGLKKQQRTHCKNGHEFNVENTFISHQGWRICRKCRCNREKTRMQKLSVSI
jgi:hypothetical protein